MNPLKPFVVVTIDWVLSCRERHRLVPWKQFEWKPEPIQPAQESQEQPVQLRLTRKKALNMDTMMDHLHSQLSQAYNTEPCSSKSDIDLFETHRAPRSRKKISDVLETLIFGEESKKNQDTGMNNRIVEDSGMTKRPIAIDDDEKPNGIFHSLVFSTQGFTKKQVFNF